MRQLRIGLVQMAIADGEPSANLAHASALLRAAPAADLYVLPELWSTGYAHAEWRASAERDTPRACAAMQALSIERHASIAGSLISLNADGCLANRLWFFTPDAGSRYYDKGHLFPPLQEDRYLTAGTERVRIALAGWTIGLSICFDLRFPEMYRRDALEGTNFYVVVAEWPGVRAAALSVLARARAIENHAYLALCNRCGTSPDGVRFDGGSALFAPDGSVVADAGALEGIALGVIDPQQVAVARTAAPVLELRRAGLDW